MQESNEPTEDRQSSLAFAVDQCPFCDLPLSPGKPIGHWDGDGTAGFLYVADCKGCGRNLVGTGKAAGESPEVVIWTKAE
jgi:hypothetical protein